MTAVADLLDRVKARAAKRDLWLPLWQELASIYFPYRGSFVTPLMPGQEAPRELYDTTPIQACRGLATAIDGLLKPQTSKWFWMKAQDDALNDVEEAKRFFELVRERMWDAIYDPEARFIQHSGAVDNDLAAFGIGYLWIGENRARTGLNFRSLHVADCAIDENADGVVDIVDIKRRWTARQAKQRLGDKSPPKVNEALRDNKPDQPFEFVQAIHPNEDRDPRRKGDNRHMPYASCIVSLADQVIVEESGFQEFPVAVPRWAVAAGEVYPRSSGMIALPDARTLQAMGHTLLVGGQRAVDPPTWVVDEAVLSAVRTFPGGLTVIDAEAARLSGGKPIGQLEMGADIPVGREMQNDYRAMVEAAFFKNVFNLPAADETGKMTAYEVSQRKEEFLRTIGPTFGQLENDYIGAIIRRVYGIMLRANGDPANGGAFGPIPEMMANVAAEFEFMSPVQQAKRAIEAASLGHAFQTLTPVLQIDPTAADNFDTDEMVRDAPEAFSLPQKYIRPKDQVEQRRQAKAQAAQAANMMASGQQLADILKTTADAGHAGARGQAALAQANAPAG